MIDISRKTIHRTLLRLEPLILIHYKSLTLSLMQKRALAAGIAANILDSYVKSSPWIRGGRREILRAASEFTSLAASKFQSMVGIYQFRLNPRSVNIPLKKLMSQVNYGWGYFDMVESGDDLLDIKWDGSAGFFEPFPGFKQLLGFLIGGKDIRLSYAWYKMKELEHFFLTTDGLVMIYWMGDVFYGWLTSFSYSQNTDLETINYSLSVKALPYARAGLYRLSLEVDVPGLDPVRAKIKTGPQTFVRSIVDKDWLTMNDALKYSTEDLIGPAEVPGSLGVV